MKACIKVLQEPYNQCRCKNNRKRFLDKAFCLLPDQLPHTFCRRKPVVWKFHNKRNRFAFKFRHFQDQCIQNPTEDSCEIKTDHHNTAPLLREKCAGEKSVDRKLGTAAHKWSKQDRHLPVTLTGKCPRCHNSRHRTAKSDQHRHKTSSGKSDLSKKFIHNKGNTRHIPGVLQDRQEKKQGDNGRKKTDHASDTT